MSHRLKKAKIIALSFFAATYGIGAAAIAQDAPNQQTLQRLMSAQPQSQGKRLSPVREAALKAAARTVGTQTGLIERAQEIIIEVDKRRAKMENLFRFGDLVIGAGVLPPVLVHTENAAAVTGDTMRLAGAIYQIRYPARFFSGAPSWRDWLLMGLPTLEEMPDLPKNEQLLPRDADERAYWEQQVRDAYFSGRAQAQEVFDNNLSNLEEVYNGMRTFYDLFQRNMVSAPVIAKSQEIITQDDPNTIVVGDTLFRITVPSSFKTDPAKWKALSAKPSVDMPLPVVPGYDRKQVEAAYQEFKRQQQEKKGAAVRDDTASGQKPESKATTKPSAAKPKTATPENTPPADKSSTAEPAPVEQFANVRMETLKIDIPTADMAGSIESEKKQIGPSGDRPYKSAGAAAAQKTQAQPSSADGVSSAPLFAVPTQ